MKWGRNIIRVLVVAAALLGIAAGASVTAEWKTEEAMTQADEPQRSVSENETQDTPRGEEAGTDAREQTVSANDAQGALEKKDRSAQKVRGIYVTGPMAGSVYIDDLIALVDETELNAMVVDVKNDEGNITYKMDCDKVKDMGTAVNYIPDIEGFMDKMKEHGIYTIARIACFKDSCLAQKRPDWAVRKEDGTLLTAADGSAWVNPCEEAVWEYLADVAVASAEVGFDEIQFDYVRFPIGEEAARSDYGAGYAETVSRRQAITGFLAYAAERLHEEQVVLGADLFGTVIESSADQESTGQDYCKIGSMVDVLSPMVYPSHYQNGVYGLDVPDAYPYETVLGALKASRRELDRIEEQERAIVRPWLQSFTATWIPGHISYGDEEIRAQIQAVYDAGYDEWILWNAANRYPREGLEQR